MAAPGTLHSASHPEGRQVERRGVEGAVLIIVVHLPSLSHPSQCALFTIKHHSILMDLNMLRGGRMGLSSMTQRLLNKHLKTQAPASAQLQLNSSQPSVLRVTPNTPHFLYL
ncbi:hypothetical protein E2C01_048765 [Portunus trituberculatus]|uniref:Uncharacterized protein n=1 Tax=Portunus trituberculatus TaxID=210409 RepID=A0A5B7GBE3_PORTR|nr:hypothetical protein [Portunus trituberculatus]